MSLKDSRSLRSPQLGLLSCQSGRRLLPLLCYYFEVIWRHLKVAQRLANNANQKRVLKTRDIPMLTDPSPPCHQLGLPVQQHFESFRKLADPGRRREERPVKRKTKYILGVVVALGGICALCVAILFAYTRNACQAEERLKIED